MLGGTVGTPNPEAMARFFNWMIDTCIEIERQEAEAARLATEKEAIMTKARYELKQEGFSDVFEALNLKDATDLAQHMLDTGEGNHVTITDRRARKDKPKQYIVKVCTGEAHSNPWIDHCNVCMPNWGIVVEAVQQ